MTSLGTNRVQAGYQGGGGQGSDSMWPKVLKVTGIGCAIICLVGAILMGFGVFRMATCCSDLEGLEAASQEAQDEGYRFAVELHEGDYDGAYARLDDSAKSETSREEFGAQFEEWRPYLDASQPFPVTINVDETDFDLMDVSSMNTWKLKTWYAAPDSNEIVHLSFSVESELQEDETRTVGITDWYMEREDRDLRHDPYVQTAQSFHDRLKRQNFEQAQHLVSADGEYSWLDEELFVEEVTWLVDELERMASDDVVGIFPNDPNTLVVTLLVTSEEGATFNIDYVINWRREIHTVSELRPVTVQPEVIDDVVDESDDEEEGADEEGLDEEVESEEESEAPDEVEN